MSRALAHELQQATAKLRAQHGAVAPVRMASLCRRCRRELVVQTQQRVGGRVTIAFTCPKHGTLKPGEQYAMAYVSESE